MAQFKDFAIPLRTTLVAAVVVAASLCTFFTVGIVGVPSYFSAKAKSQGLWMELAKQSAQTGEEQILRYFQSAPICLKMIEGLVQEEALEIKTRENIFDICYRTLKENPEFATVYYTSAAGELFAVLKEGLTFTASHRVAGIEQIYLQKSGLWVKTGEERTGYDPQKRPFWSTGQMHPSGAWTEVYEFADTLALGYTFVLAQMGKKGVEGYWAVDFQIDQLNEFLHSLNIGEHGRVYIVENNGQVIAESALEFSESLDLVKKHWKEHSKDSQFVQIKNWIFYINRFPQESQIPWSLVTAIEATDFLLPIRQKALIYLSLGLLPLLAFLFLSSLFFSRISERLRRISRQMDQVGDLSFEADGIRAKKSRIIEVNNMELSLQKMKVGLHSFAKYVPVDLVKKLLRSGKAAELHGEKRSLTIFFADLANFSSISELMQPDEIAEILKEFLTIASGEIHKEKGIIDKFMGDAVMALWGAPDPMELHAIAACRTALSLRKLTFSHPMLKNKIGINTGSVVVGNFGAEERMDYTAIGDAVNIASRLEKLNVDYGTTILIGEETALAVKDHFLIRPIDQVILKGRKQPHLIYELIAHKGQSDEKIVQGVDLYTAALKLYLEGKFRDAIPLFEKANSYFGGQDLASKLLIERCSRSST